jgi:ribosomal protein S18 acetylase RimI-like enzyme
MAEIAIRPLGTSKRISAALSAMIVEAVTEGASVSFMHPLSPIDATAFWEHALVCADRGERIVLGAFDDDELVGTVTALLDVPQNQSHRAEIVKLITRGSHRGRGIATKLMAAIEAAASERGRTLLSLDTAADGGASKLYEGLGFTLAGAIPDYALKPFGGLTAAKFYWKRIGPSH